MVGPAISGERGGRDGLASISGIYGLAKGVHDALLVDPLLESFRSVHGVGRLSVAVTETNGKGSLEVLVMTPNRPSAEEWTALEESARRSATAYGVEIRVNFVGEIRPFS